MARTPQEIFQHHAEALVAGDIDELVADGSRVQTVRYTAEPLT